MRVTVALNRVDERDLKQTEQLCVLLMDEAIQKLQVSLDNNPASSSQPRTARRRKRTACRICACIGVKPLHRLARARLKGHLLRCTRYTRLPAVHAAYTVLYLLDKSQELEPLLVLRQAEGKTETVMTIFDMRSFRSVP